MKMHLTEISHYSQKTPVHQKWTICKKMDKENGLHFVTDGFTPASAGFNGLQRASLRF
jgi:hypothetical protein